MRIPKDLLHVLGREWIASLNTGDYQLALKRHSEEAARFHLKVLTERTRLGRAAPSAIPDRGTEGAYYLVKKYFDQQIASLAESEPTRLDLLINPRIGAPDPHDILVNLDTDLVDTLDSDGEYARRRERELVQQITGTPVVADTIRDPFTNDVSRLVRDAMVEIAAQQRAIFLGEDTPTHLKRFSRHSPPEVPSVAFGVAAERFLRNKLTVETVRSRTTKKYEATLDFLVRHFGRETPISSITRADALEFRDLMADAPTNAVQRYGRDLSLRELVKKRGDAKYLVMSHSTQTTYLEMAERLFGWAVTEGYIEKTPAHQLLSRAKKVALEDRRDPYTAEELTKIFAAPIYTGCLNDGRGYATKGTNIIKRSRYWLPLIALFSGMRPEEILQIGPKNIGTTKAGSIYFDLDRDMNLKTMGSRREVPVHPTILAAGFMKFVEEKRKSSATLLFDDVPVASDGTRSGTWSKRYATFSRSVGVKAELNCFYSFRHTFRDAMRAAEIPEEQGQMLQGWTGRSETSSRTYGKGYRVDQLAKWMAKIEYDDLDLSHLIDPDAGLQ